MTDLFAEQARKKFEGLAKSWLLKEHEKVAAKYHPGSKNCLTCNHGMVDGNVVTKMANFAAEQVQAAQPPSSWYEEKARLIAEANLKNYRRSDPEWEPLFAAKYSDALQILKGD